MSCGILLAFLFTAMHVVVDHGVGGQTSFALLPHPCLSSASGDDHPVTYHPDQEETPWPGHYPTDHQAETHSHFTWYTSAPVKLALHVLPSVLAADVWGLFPPMMGAATLCGTTSTSPPRGSPLYLLCSVLLI
ncbi:MAG TPA: hypothetical protein VI542_35280 [Candidatus Tectomicrobia bacterium]